MPMNRDDERQANGRFCCGDGDRKDHEHHVRQILAMRTKGSERDKIEIRGI